MTDLVFGKHKNSPKQTLVQSGWLGVVLLTPALLAGCAGLPERPSNAASVHLEKSGETFLRHLLAPMVTEHPGVSGVYPVEHGVDAFAARLALARLAERSLDVQYYIWRADTSGKLLAHELIEAADRGVHVRLLLDDIGTAASDANLLALDSHTNIEVRLFNPVSNRNLRKLGALFEFGRINRRMHNKSFTADNEVTIIGGRNIGDEYFGAGSEVEFADFDVMCVGAVVSATKSAFDLYWSSPSSMSIASLNRKRVSPERTMQRRAGLAHQAEAIENSAYLATVRDSRLMAELREGRIDWYWGHAELVYDLPDKVTSAQQDSSTHLLPQLRGVADATERELVIVSPYFVPGKRGMTFFEMLRKRGVRVVIITNSLQATDVVAVHAGYERYRKALLRAGIELYEIKATPRHQKPRHGNDDSGSASSRTSLHAKTFVFDERIIFVGSLNFDPRSVYLNTEIGAVIEVPSLAVRVTDLINRNVTPNAYRLELVPGRGLCRKQGQVNWVVEENGSTARYTRDPGASFRRRLLVRLLSLLPIESQL